MKTLSTTTRQRVKQKPQNISALPDSVNLQLGIPPAEPAVKEPQTQDLQKPGPGDSDPFELQKDIGVACARRDGKGLSLTARYHVGIIGGYCGVGRWGFLSEDKISHVARCSRGRVSRSVLAAVEDGCLDVNSRGRCHKYHISPLFGKVKKIWVNPALVRDDGLSIVDACFVGYVKFRQGDNGGTWFAHQEFAVDLGVSYHTAARAAASCAAQGYVQKRHRPWRRSSKNEYALTGKADSTIGVSGLKTARPKWSALGQTIREGGPLYANSVRNGRFRADLGLSFDSRQDGAACAALRSIGVHGCVARLIAVAWRGRYDSVRQMVINGLFRRDDYFRRLRWSGERPGRFNLAGYVVKGLNMAETEGHQIRPSKLAVKDQVKGDDQVEVVTYSCHREAEFAKRRAEQKRRLLSTPAKSHTSYSDVELAVIESKRDKGAEAENLRSIQRAAGSRYYIGRKWMKSPAKAGFSVAL